MKRLSLCLLLAASSLAAAQTPPITKAQPELSKEKLVIVTHDGRKLAFDVEMALTPREQEVGEMFRTSIPPDGGMLFDWGRPKDSTMWMRNCPVSEDMVFINEDGTIRSIAENTTPESMAVIPSRGPVRATLELAGGRTAELDIRPGDKVEQRIFGPAG
jgi:uncharacterized membrane protein (UPF0127 family)